jgi:molybdenum cofactor guanylyltransferase
MSFLVGVVLCGGRSRRMGVDKATLKIDDDQTYLQQAVSRLAEVCAEVWISQQADQGWTHPAVTRSIIDPLMDGGPMAGICESLRQAQAAGREAILFCPIDLPELKVDQLQTLINRFQQKPVLTVAQFDRMQPLLGIYPTRYLGDIQSEVAQGHFGVTRWVKGIEHQAVALPWPVGRNVNRPDDLEDPD